MSDSINNRFKSIRSELGLTQKEFAAKLEVAFQFIGNVEIGRQSPSFNLVTLLQKKFNVSIDWLLTGEGEMFLPSQKAANQLKTKNHLTVHDGDAEIYQVDEENIHHTVYWEHRSADERFIMAAFPEMSEEGKKRLRYAADADVMAERRRKEIEEGSEEKTHQKGEADAG